MSILVPAWNEAVTIAECVADIRAQVGVDWECVLVLDGPSDGTERRVAELVRGDERFRVLERPHEGLVAALEAGHMACRADYIARFDADDRMHPDRLREQVAYLDRHPEVGVVSCRVAHGLIGGGEAPAGMVRHVAWWNGLTDHDTMSRARFIDAPICHPTAMMRRAHVSYRAGPFAEDHDLWLRLLAAGVRFGKVDRTLVTWRERPERATRVDTRYDNEHRRALVHEHLRRELGGRQVRIWGAGEYGRWHGRCLRQAGVVIDDVIDIDPKKVGRRVLSAPGLDGVPVVSPESLGEPDGRCVLACVASQGAQALIRARLNAAGWREGQDWWALQ